MTFSDNRTQEESFRVIFSRIQVKKGAAITNPKDV